MPILQIHALTSHAPSNLNRDENGAPKTAAFGGTPRGRISSQCLKRAVRMSPQFRSALADLPLGRQTNTLPALIRQHLLDMGALEPTANAIARKAVQFGSESAKRPQPAEAEEEILPAAGAEAAADQPKKGKKAKKGHGGDEDITLTTSQLMRLSTEEPAQIARVMLELYNADPTAWDALPIAGIARKIGALRPKAVDIALFGRFVTSSALADVPAATQFMHAISTTALLQQDDFFVGVDDLAGGSPMLGTTFYNANVYYSYANVDLGQLARNLGSVPLARRVASAFVPACILARPSGFQNAYASLPLPDFVLVEYSPQDVLTLNYANAFLSPVQATLDSSLMDSSVRALTGYVARLDRVYPRHLLRAYIGTDARYQLANACDAASLPEIVAWVTSAMDVQDVRSDGGA